MTSAAIHRIQPPIVVLTPRGPGLALFLIDYGPCLNSIWLVRHDETGDVYHRYAAHQVRLAGASEPTAAEARQAVIVELREWVGQAINHAMKSRRGEDGSALSAWEDVDAKLTELERGE